MTFFFGFVFLLVEVEATFGEVSVLFFPFHSDEAV